MVRIGRNNDGGYLVSLSDIKKSNLLIGLGIGDDWSFESDFEKYNNCEVIAFDASLDFLFLLKRIIIETIKKLLNFNSLKKLYSYKNFFRGKRKHIKKFVGLNSSHKMFYTFQEVINRAWANHKKIFFFVT